MALRTATVTSIAASTLAAFVGREREISDVLDLLSQRRLVTLTGPGGTGKTRLAVEIASRIVEEAVVVELSPLSEPALVRPAVATAVGLGEADDEALLADLTGRDLLIVLDNCEHLIEACAHLVVDVLRTCRDVRVLVTSRRPLGTAAETTYRVPPLSLPDVGTRPEDSEAVRLFVERAGRARPGFALSATNAASVATICTRLDGLPLGLELAAARLRAFEVHEIETQLDDRLAFLTSNDPIAPARQRTLRALLDWSFDLLTDQQRVLFRRLGIFAGGATLDAVVDVCSDPLLPPADIPGLVLDLVDHSLLLPEEADGRTRLHLLDTIGDYARSHLDQVDERGWLAARHLDRSIRWARKVREERFTSDQAADMRRLSAELPNLRRALDHALDQDPVAGLQLASALEILWLVGGHLAEGRERLEALLEAAENVPADIRRSALRVSGRICLVGGDPESAEVRLRSALELARRAGDRREVAELLQLLGQVLEALERTDGSRAAAREALAVLRREVAGPGIDDDAANRLRWALSTLGDAVRDAGDPEEAEALYTEALQLAMDHPDRHDEAMIICSLADLAIDARDPVRARTLVERALDIQTELGDRNCIARSHELLDRVEELESPPGRGAHLQRALALRVELGQPREAVRALERLADRLVAAEPERAHELSELAGRIRTSPNDPRHLQEAARLASPDDAAPDPPAPRPSAATGRFIREGQVWVIGFADRTVRLRDTKGLRYLAVLLARPWHDVHVMELTSALAGAPVEGGAGLAVTRGGDAGELLDDQARRAYRRRIVELQDDIDEAERFHDDERAARARAEHDQLVHELSAAFGLGGRPRRAADPSERARKAVYNRIRAATATIAAEHPLLGEHLERAVHTGLFCSYCPDRPTIWET